MRRYFPFLSGALAATLVAGAPAVGQEPVSALRGHNTNAPVDVAADRIEVQTRADRAVFSGNVVATQGSLTLNAARVTIAYRNADGPQIQRLDASGGVTVRSPSETARGQFAVYDTQNRLITLLGGVVLTRADSQVRGGRLVLDLDSGRAVMDGGRGAGSAPGATSNGGRVTGTFSVPQKRD